MNKYYKAWLDNIYYNLYVWITWLGKHIYFVRPWRENMVNLIANWKRWVVEFVHAEFFTMQMTIISILNRVTKTSCNRHTTISETKLTYDQTNLLAEVNNFYSNGDIFLSYTQLPNVTPLLSLIQFK